ncbi:MAG TPA: hypothetical protein VFJ58_15455 [Armatimonadota bacterium]|nr:hypothetical protein [Armatimonadota bacterium]
MKSFCRYSAAAVAALTVCALLAPPVRADTSYIREMAKHKSPVLIIASGPAATRLAQTLQSAILARPENKHTAADLPILSLDAAAQQAAGSAWGQSTHVFLLDRKEMAGALTPALAGALPEPFSLDSTISLLVGAERDGKKGLYNVLLGASDAERLSRVAGIFQGVEVPNYRQLNIRRTFFSNRLAIFSDPSERADFDGWSSFGSGKADAGSSSGVWNDVQWHPLADAGKLTDRDRQERIQVYFVDRSHGPANLPPAAAALLPRHMSQTTTVINSKVDSQRGEGVVLFDAPTALILKMKAARYQSWQRLPDGPAVQNAVDLRRIGTCTLLVPYNATSLSPADAEAIRQPVAAEMRQKLHLDIQERGALLQDLEGVVTTDQLLGATDTGKAMREKVGLRYVWIYRITGYQGSTSYQPQQRRVTPVPDAFSEYEPQQPSRSKGLFRGNKPEDQYLRELAEWRVQHKNWEVDRQSYNNHLAEDPCQWRRSVQETSSATVQGTLQLIDLRGVGKVVWEHDCSAQQSTDPTQFSSDYVTVSGFNNPPDSLQPPPASSSCPANLLHQAALHGADEALAALQENALLPQPGGSGAAPPADTSGSGSATRDVGGVTSPAGRPAETAVVPGPPLAGPHVAVVQGNLVIVADLDRDSGIKPGDSVKVLLKVKEIKDPVTGEVIDRITGRGMMLKAKAVKDKATECVPATAADAALLPEVKSGMVVSWTRAKPAAPVKRPTKKAAPAKKALSAHRRRKPKYRRR